MSNNNTLSDCFVNNDMSKLVGLAQYVLGNVSAEKTFHNNFTNMDNSSTNSIGIADNYSIAENYSVTDNNFTNNIGMDNNFINNQIVENSNENNETDNTLLVGVNEIDFNNYSFQSIQPVPPVPPIQSLETIQHQSAQKSPAISISSQTFQPKDGKLPYSPLSHNKRNHKPTLISEHYGGPLSVMPLDTGIIYCHSNYTGPYSDFMDKFNGTKIPISNLIDNMANIEYSNISIEMNAYNLCSTVKCKVNGGALFLHPDHFESILQYILSYSTKLRRQYISNHFTAIQSPVNETNHFYRTAIYTNSECWHDAKASFNGEDNKFNEILRSIVLTIINDDVQLKTTELKHDRIIIDWNIDENSVEYIQSITNFLASLDNLILVSFNFIWFVFNCKLRPQSYEMLFDEISKFTPKSDRSVAFYLKNNLQTMLKYFLHSNESSTNFKIESVIKSVNVNEIAIKGLVNRSCYEDLIKQKVTEFKPLPPPPHPAAATTLKNIDFIKKMHQLVLNGNNNNNMSHRINFKRKREDEQEQDEKEQEKELDEQEDDEQEDDEQEKESAEDDEQEDDEQEDDEQEFESGEDMPPHKKMFNIFEKNRKRKIFELKMFNKNFFDNHFKNILKSVVNYDDFSEVIKRKLKITSEVMVNAIIEKLVKAYLIHPLSKKDPNKMLKKDLKRKSQKIDDNLSSLIIYLLSECLDTYTIFFENILQLLKPYIDVEQFHLTIREMVTRINNNRRGIVYAFFEPTVHMNVLFETNPRYPKRLKNNSKAVYIDHSQLSLRSSASITNKNEIDDNSNNTLIILTFSDRVAYYTKMFDKRNINLIIISI